MVGNGHVMPIIYCMGVGAGFADISSGLLWSSTVIEMEIPGSLLKDLMAEVCFLSASRAESRFHQQGKIEQERSRQGPDIWRSGSQY